MLSGLSSASNLIQIPIENMSGMWGKILNRNLICSFKEWPNWMQMSQRLWDWRLNQRLNSSPLSLWLNISLNINQFCYTDSNQQRTQRNWISMWFSAAKWPAILQHFSYQEQTVLAHLTHVITPIQYFLPKQTIICIENSKLIDLWSLKVNWDKGQKMLLWLVVTLSMTINYVL